LKEKLLKIQQEIGAIKKDKKGVYNMYIDINTLLAEVKPVLNKHGVVLMQALTHVDGKIALQTNLIDTEEDGEGMFYIVPLPDCADAQKYGSAITYFRRYSIIALLALESEEDDDGQLASAPVKYKDEKPNPSTKKPAVESDLPF
jgi:hypothetical protein